jgi:hypothetical protein
MTHVGYMSYQVHTGRYNIHTDSGWDKEGHCVNTMKEYIKLDTQIRIGITCYFILVVLIQTWRKREDYNFVYKFHRQVVMEVSRFDIEQHIKYVVQEMNTSRTNLRYTGGSFDYQHVDLPAYNVP